MANTVKYFYTGTAPNNYYSFQSILKLDNENSLTINPLFNFNQKFIDDLHSMSPTKLAQSQPYISIKIIDPNGSIIEDLNLSFFHKPFSPSQMSADKRYSERPIMSLKSLSTSTDMASGYLYYTNVTLQLKIHRPDALSSSFVLALLFPGMPFLLEYGWNSPESALNQKERVMFAVKTYNFTMDITGQMDLTIEGMSFNEQFNNVYIGDGTDPNTGQYTSDESVDGLAQYKKKMDKMSKYLSELKAKPDSSINDYSLLNEYAEMYSKSETKTRGKISKAYHKLLASLEPTDDITFVKKGKKAKPASGATPATPAVPPKKIKIPAVTFHNMLVTLCDNTFLQLSNLITNIEEFRVVYGTFNEFAGKYSNKSIADFLIPLRKFKESLKSDVGSRAPTIQTLLNTVMSDFMENETYTKSDLVKKEEGEAETPQNTFNIPDVVCHFLTRSIKNPKNNKDTIVMELYVFDSKAGLPITTVEIRNLTNTEERKKMSANKVTEQITRKSQLPVIRTGHANSFIKSLSLNQVADQYMKAVMLQRQTTDRVEGPKSTSTEEDKIHVPPITPLTLPLQGSMSVLGHIHWKPFRAFYLSSGLFIVDGVYKITKVTHNLSKDGYTTDMEFVWH